jgi:hypothetical protein
MDTVLERIPAVTETTRLTAFRMFTDRYKYDFTECRPVDGWKQFDTDQDAWYFGIWVHTERMVIVTYAEGDEYIDLYVDRSEFKAELARLGDVYGPPPPAAVGISLEGQITNYYDTRPTGELPA